MPNWTELITAGVLLALGGPTVVRGLVAWWRAERELYERAGGRDEEREVRW